MKLIFYLAALWPLISVIVVFAFCRAIHIGKVRERAKKSRFEA